MKNYRIGYLMGTSENFLCGIFRGALMLALLSTMGTPGPAGADPMASAELATRHTSVFNRISYRIPKSWVVVDGMSDWLAPTHDKQFWKPGFNAETDAYYVVSVIFPYLTLEDMEKKRVRSLGDIVRATRHALEVAAGAQAPEALEFFRLNDNEAAALSTTMRGSHSHYQVFVRIAAHQVATVAGNGPREQLDSIRRLVSAIAATIEPAEEL